MGHPDRVEIKLTVAADAVPTARERLGFTDRDASRASIWFCDRLGGGSGRARRELELFDLGLIVRLRDKIDADSDATVKYRRKEPLELPKRWADTDDHRDYTIEGDWAGASRQVSASIASTVSGDAIDELVRRGSSSVTSLLTGDQEELAHDLAGTSKAVLASLQPLGPVQALRWEEAMNEDLGREVGGEQWIAGDLLFLELSIRAKFAKAEAWQERFTDWAADTGLELSGLPTTKTQAVLEHFAGCHEP